MQANIYGFSGYGYCTSAGRSASFKQVIAEFYPVGAALLGSNGRLYRIYTNFNGYVLCHRFSKYPCKLEFLETNSDMRANEKRCLHKKGNTQKMFFCVPK
jgi:hypothetical protein